MSIKHIGTSIYRSAENHKTIPVKERTKKKIDFHFCFVYLLLSIRPVRTSPQLLAACRGTVGQLTNKDLAGICKSKVHNFPGRNQAAHHVSSFQGPREQATYDTSKIPALK